jgi:hypothetical protein
MGFCLILDDLEKNYREARKAVTFVNSAERPDWKVGLEYWFALKSGD